MSDDSRECPECRASNEYKPLVKSGNPDTECVNCGAKLILQWERIETADGHEDAFYFEINK